MLLFLIILFGAGVLVELHTISKRLEHIGGAKSGDGAELSQLKGELQEIRKEIAGQAEQTRTYLKDELQCYNDHSFAHDLRDQLREIPKEIVEELQWLKDATFADELKEWIETAATSVSNALETQERTLTVIENSLSNMEASLSSIDANTAS